MPRKLSTKGLRRKAWVTFSDWIRQRGKDENEQNVCISCGKKDFWRNLHAGHFFHGKHYESFFDERNVWPQCPKCNTYLSGNLIEYSEFLRDKFGPDIIETLRELKNKPTKLSRSDYEAIIEKYKGKE